MDNKLKINIGRMSIEADANDIQFVMGEEIKPGTDLHQLNIDINESVNAYSRMGYTTDFDTLKLILENMTLRCSSLSNANLNDPMEKERVDVSEYAYGKYIVCFCHSDHEIVPFWMYYGKKNRKNKVLLLFKNFADRFKDCIYTDFAFTNGGKKCYFKCDEFGKAITAKTFLGKELNPEYDYRSYIDSVMMFNVEYIPIESDVFTKSNTKDTLLSLENNNGENHSLKIKAIDPTVLGKQKSDPWDYENETRILCTILEPKMKGWDYIDLRLKPEFFRDLCIVLSPWDEGDLRDNIVNIIESIDLPNEIKESIIIKDSGLKDKLNFPE